jgi:hypothetical protein
MARADRRRSTADSFVDSEDAPDLYLTRITAGGVKRTG